MKTKLAREAQARPKGSDVPGPLRQQAAPRHAQQGQVLVMLALFLVVLVCFVALIADVARAQLDGNYTQRAADSASLAGVIYMPAYFGTADANFGCNNKENCDNAITRTFRALAHNGYANSDE